VQLDSPIANFGRENDVRCSSSPLQGARLFCLKFNANWLSR
jgi:hypothetical protein